MFSRNGERVRKKKLFGAMIGLGGVNWFRRPVCTAKYSFFTYFRRMRNQVAPKEDSECAATPEKRPIALVGGNSRERLYITTRQALRGILSVPFTPDTLHSYSTPTFPTLERCPGSREIHYAKHNKIRSYATEGRNIRP